MNRPVEFSVTNTGNTVLASGEHRAGDTVASVQITAAGTTPTIVWEISNDNTNWVASSGRVAGTSGSAAASIGSTGIWSYMVQSRYWRLRASAGSGTVAGVVCFGEGWII
jgi:hypothetical protein